jgi:hypothetical protein
MEFDRKQAEQVEQYLLNQKSGKIFNRISRKTGLKLFFREGKKIILWFLAGVTPILACGLLVDCLGRSLSLPELLILPCGWAVTYTIWWKWIKNKPEYLITEPCPCCGGKLFHITEDRDVYLVCDSCKKKEHTGLSFGGAD